MLPWLTKLLYSQNLLLSEFLYRTMFRHGSFLWVSLRAFVINIIWFAAKCIERLKVDCKNPGNGANFNGDHSQEGDRVASMSSRDLEPDFSEEKRSSEFSFSFLSQESKDSRGNSAETDDSAFVQSGYIASTRKYQFVSGKNVIGFVQKPETMSFTVQEMCVGSTDVFISNDDNLDLGAYMNEHVKGGNSEEKVAEFVSKDSSIGSIEEPNLEEESLRMQENFKVKQEANSAENRSVNDEEINDLEDRRLEEDDDVSYDLQLLPRNEFSVSDLNPKPESSGDDSCANNNLQVQPENTEVSSDELPNEILASSTHMHADERMLETIERRPRINMFIKEEAIVTEDTSEDADYIELEPDAKSAINTGEESLLQKIDTLNHHEFDGSKEFGTSSLEKEFWESDSDDDEDELDILLEHQQLVQQMKMEMKNSKIKTLPTISEEEECETPKMVQDLRPLKIEEKFEYKDLMEEIHKFYKSYAERMRKLDILNYQSLHAINIVLLKDSQVFVSSKKDSFSSKHFALPNFGIGKQRKIFADPCMKSITKMQRDLELVYIGQVCLSWEILRWQYGKLKLLLEYDSQGYHSYNLVAGEYQQLQVHIQRFLEDEPFQGPRIQHYVRSRCLCRSLLQVPIIKDDCFKDKGRLVGEKDAIPISKLEETIKESMQVFWEFIRSDKDETSGALKGVQRNIVDHPNPADLELLMNIRTCLEKKERKLKDIQRSANCIVKKFQKHHAGGRPSSAVFISQVELKLVSRVLNLSRLTTDQLLWCQKKLNSINIVNGKVHVEPAFLLFPC